MKFPEVTNENLYRTYRKKAALPVILEILDEAAAALGVDRKKLAARVGVQFSRTNMSTIKRRLSLQETCDRMIAHVYLARDQLQDPPPRSELSIHSLGTSGLISSNVQTVLARSVFNPPIEAVRKVLTTGLTDLTAADYTNFTKADNVGAQAVLETIALAEIIGASPLFGPPLLRPPLRPVALKPDSVKATEDAQPRKELRPVGFRPSASPYDKVARGYEFLGIEQKSLHRLMMGIISDLPREMLPRGPEPLLRHVDAIVVRLMQRENLRWVNNDPITIDSLAGVTKPGHGRQAAVLKRYSALSPQFIDHWRQRSQSWTFIDGRLRLLRDFPVSDNPRALTKGLIEGAGMPPAMALEVPTLFLARECILKVREQKTSLSGPGQAGQRDSLFYKIKTSVTIPAYIAPDEGKDLLQRFAAALGNPKTRQKALDLLVPSTGEPDRLAEQRPVRRVAGLVRS